MNFTPLVKPHFVRRARRTLSWASDGDRLQSEMLRRLLARAASTEVGKRYGFTDILRENDPAKAFAQRVPCIDYETMRGDVWRMIKGGRDILWPGRCRWYAQSSGTSGGKSKYIPITDDSLHLNHYRGAEDSVSHYIAANPATRIFAGKGMILGGSFANEIPDLPKGVHVGDLSATLINRINPLADRFRVPDMRTALMPDWQDKLPALVKASMHADITNISGVPSWFLTVIKEVMHARGVSRISDAWPNLEVFFHGGISFEPYRAIYSSLTDPAKMHFVETYNASEGFFAVQNDLSDPAMLLLIDNDIFYEFIDISDPSQTIVSIRDVRAGHVYELLITSSNGLWRYHLGDTVRVESTSPVKIRVAGRTKTFINAFGEELMEENAERAIAAACLENGCSIRNYTASPVFATGNTKGRHQWLVEWLHAPSDTGSFSAALDLELRQLNSDYDAKRSHTIFLDPPEIISLPAGTFDRWLRSVGTGKLGGQRKIPRLSNTREISDAILAMTGNRYR